MNYSDIEKNLIEEINFYNDRIKAWGKVVFKTKKDGTEFKTLSRNFENAEIGSYYPVEDYAHPYLTVFGYDKNNKHFSDNIPIHYDKYIHKYLPEENAEREERISKWGTKTYILTVPEIQLAILKTIGKYKDLKELAENSLKNSRADYDLVSRKLEEIKRIIIGGEHIGIHDRTPLMYELEKVVKDFHAF